MFFPFKPLKGNFLKCTPSGWCHETSIFKIHTPLHIELGPMALGTARGEALCQATIRQPLEGAIYPTKTKSLFYNLNVWYSWPLWAST